MSRGQHMGLACSRPWAPPQHKDTECDFAPFEHLVTFFCLIAAEDYWHLPREASGVTKHSNCALESTFPLLPTKIYSAQNVNSGRAERSFARLCHAGCMSGPARLLPWISWIRISRNGAGWTGGLKIFHCFYVNPHKLEKGQQATEHEVRLLPRISLRETENQNTVNTVPAPGNL